MLLTSRSAVSTVLPDQLASIITCLDTADTKVMAVTASARRQTVQVSFFLQMLKPMAKQRQILELKVSQQRRTVMDYMKLTKMRKKRKTRRPCRRTTFPAPCSMALAGNRCCFLNHCSSSMI